MELSYKIWLILGLALMVAEILLPGLVVIFVGLGAITVAVGIHFSYLNTISSQLITFFISSLIYLFTLRLLLLRFVPTDTRKANVNEDDEVIGQVVNVVEKIPTDGFGRIDHSGTSWKAKTEAGTLIGVGQQVEIVGRDNITWIVKKI